MRKKRRPKQRPKRQLRKKPLPQKPPRKKLRRSGPLPLERPLRKPQQSQRLRKKPRLSKLRQKRRLPSEPRRRRKLTRKRLQLPRRAWSQSEACAFAPTITPRPRWSQVWWMAMKSTSSPPGRMARTPGQSWIRAGPPWCMMARPTSSLLERSSGFQIHLKISISKENGMAHTVESLIAMIPKTWPGEKAKQADTIIQLNVTGSQAFMQGKAKVQGDLSEAMELVKVFMPR